MAQINLTQRQYLYIAAGVILVVLIGVLAWLYFRSADDAIDPTNTTNQTANVAVVDVTTTNTATPVTVDPVVLDATRLAQFFTERYGSYTSESNFINMTNLKPYMTARMQQSADDYVRRQPGQSGTATYTDVVTKVLSTQIESQDAAGATIRLSTQRIESGDASEAQDMYYQDIVLELVYEDGGWLVQSATWQDKGITAPTATVPDAEVDIDELFNQ